MWNLKRNILNDEKKSTIKITIDVHTHHLSISPYFNTYIDICNKNSHKWNASG